MVEERWNGNVETMFNRNGTEALKATFHLSTNMKHKILFAQLNNNFVFHVLLLHEVMKCSKLTYYTEKKVKRNGCRCENETDHEHISRTASVPMSSAIVRVKANRKPMNAFNETIFETKTKLGCYGNGKSLNNTSNLLLFKCRCKYKSQYTDRRQCVYLHMYARKKLVFLVVQHGNSTAFAFTCIFVAIQRKIERNMELSK